MNELRANAQAHLMPHFTKGAAWRSESLVVMERGEGCYVYDNEGNRYLDGLAGLFCTNLGHGRTDLSAAALKQMDTLAYYPTWGFANEPATRTATMIAEEAPGDLDEVFFVNSGSEAVESALKFARNYHLSQGDDQRCKVIAREWAYHGTTLGALSVTGIPKYRDPFLPMLWDGVRHVRNTLGDTVPEGSAGQRTRVGQGRRGDDPRRGPRNGCRRVRRAGAERARRPRPAAGILAGTPADLRPSTASCSSPTKSSTVSVGSATSSAASATTSFPT